MGARGPKPLPTELKQRRGTLKKSRDKHVPISALVKVDEFKPPAILSRPEKAIWQSQVGLLAAAGVLREVDGPSLEAMVLAIHGWRECMAAIRLDGFVIDNTITGGFTQKQAHPLIAPMRAFQMDYYKWCAKFGLTPSDRAALGIQEFKARAMVSEFTRGLGAPEAREVIESTAVEVL